MKHILSKLLLVLLLISCNEKTVLLPETTNADITEILDVSPVYLFYDETQPDSLEFNRKNMISTTNWLVNIDKRLTLKQILPHLQYLQEKRHGDGMHTNKAAKNYFTCSNTDLKNLSFIEFTDVVYKRNQHLKLGTEFKHYNPRTESEKDSISKFALAFTQSIDVTMEIKLNFENPEFLYAFDQKIQKESLIEYIKETIIINPNINVFELAFNFSENLSFQDYIKYKSLLLQLDLENVEISNDEFIYN